jgi:REP element-mobilizing transposase RayT
LASPHPLDKELNFEHPEDYRGMSKKPTAEMKPQKPKPGSTGFQPVWTKRNLPHLERGGSTYFVTFRTRTIELPPEVCDLVCEACRYFDGQRYRLWGATVMPDHVHLLLTPLKKNEQEWFSLSAILHSLKSYTAKKINALMTQKRRVTPFWA